MVKIEESLTEAEWKLLNALLRKAAMQDIRQVKSSQVKDPQSAVEVCYHCSQPVHA